MNYFKKNIYKVAIVGQRQSRSGHRKISCPGFVCLQDCLFIKNPCSDSFINYTRFI